MRSSIMINDPAADSMKAIETALSALVILQSAISDKTLIPALSQQISDGQKLIQSEIDERDAAVKTVSDAKTQLNDLNAQMTQVQSEIIAAKQQSDADIQAAKDASDAYVKGANATVTQRWKDNDTYKTELDNREIQLQEDADQNTKDKTANTALKAQLDARQAALQKFADALSTIATNVPVLEQSPPTE